MQRGTSQTGAFIASLAGKQPKFELERVQRSVQSWAIGVKVRLLPHRPFNVDLASLESKIRSLVPRAI